MRISEIKAALLNDPVWVHEIDERQQSLRAEREAEEPPARVSVDAVLILEVKAALLSDRIWLRQMESRQRMFRTLLESLESNARIDVERLCLEYPDVYQACLVRGGMTRGFSVKVKEN